MKTSDFDFHLPKELIAQHPVSDRKSSRLLIVHKETNLLEHKHFYDIVDYLKAGDVLVRNNTRVIPARILGYKEITNAKIELLLLHNKGDVWECLVRNARAIKVGTTVIFNNGELKAKCLEVKDEGIRIMEMQYEGVFFEILQRLGNIPLPPYIKEKLDDPNKYQTVYASINGSAAAPTAGLHFTDDIIQKLLDKGVIICDVTLHVGLGTFKPVDKEDIEEHIMHQEYYQMSKETADILNEAKEEKRRIITVGTTSTRTIESIYNKHNKFIECSDSTNIFIYPGYKWKATDCIITNFHLPKSTLIMMISSFTSKELIFKAYNEAIKEGYRFFSFGDSMFITNE